MVSICHTILFKLSVPGLLNNRPMVTGLLYPSGSALGIPLIWLLHVDCSLTTQHLHYLNVCLKCTTCTEYWQNPLLANLVRTRNGAPNAESPRRFDKSRHDGCIRGIEGNLQQGFESRYCSLCRACEQKQGVI